MSVRALAIVGIALLMTAFGPATAHATDRGAGSYKVGDVVPRGTAVWFPPAEQAARNERRQAAYGIVIVGDAVVVVDETRRVVEVKR